MVADPLDKTVDDAVPESLVGASRGKEGEEHRHRPCELCLEFHPCDRVQHRFGSAERFARRILRLTEPQTDSVVGSADSAQPLSPLSQHPFGCMPIRELRQVRDVGR